MVVSRDGGRCARWRAWARVMGSDRGEGGMDGGEVGGVEEDPREGEE